MVEPPDEGVIVCTPPPTVETMVRPTLFVLVTTWPCVREGDEVPVAEGDPPAEVEADVVEVEAEPAATTPLDEVPVKDVVIGELPPAPAEVALASAFGLDAVPEVVSPP